MRCLTTGGRASVLAVLGCALVFCGCACLNCPEVDPCGQPIFSEPLVSTGPAYRDVPGPTRYWDRMDVVVCPQETVAPVGSEVIVLAGVRGTDYYLRTNHRVEWMLQPGGAGQFVELGKCTPMDLLVGDFTWPRKIDNTFAIGSTSNQYLRLTRGTLTPADDVHVLRGQAWISVTSAAEGTSRVTALAPDIYSWEQRKQTATIHWFDAQWCLPAPSINPAGTSHLLSTTVTRLTDGSPRANWRVRYEILDGPGAGFAPDGVQAIEVPTDECGQAAVEVSQQRPAPGTSQIGIQIIQPAALNGLGKRLVVGRGMTLKTWSAPDLAVRKTGPAVASVGATLTYRIEVSNPGDLPAEGVTLSDVVPDGLTYLRSSPAGEPEGTSIRWELGTLAASESRLVEVDFRADREGRVTNCAEAVAAGGLQAKACAETSVLASKIDVQIYGPEQTVTVGDTVEFEIVITNRGDVAAADLVLKDLFDPGLEHAEAISPIKRELGTLAPGQSQRVGVAFRVVGAGRLQNTVEVIGAGEVLATATAYVTAIEGPGVQPQPKIEKAPPPAGPPSVSVKMTGPEMGMVGGMAEFTVEVMNTGQDTLTEVRVVQEFDASFHAAFATGGFEPRPEGDPLAPFIWTTPTLPSGSKALFQLHCHCTAVAPAARSYVTVTSREGATGEDEVAVEIREPPLAMTVNALREPVKLGTSFTYVILVFNKSQTPDHEVTVVVTLPPELEPIKFGTTGPAGVDFDGQQILFQPVDTVDPDPDKPLEYRIRVHAAQAGEVRVRAELTSRNLADLGASITQEQTTTIFAEEETTTENN